MSNMKNGFSTLNRWLGKKNKEKATSNGKLSKSTTNLNLSVSTTNINETSQLEYNRITPLPVATSNAPFEQTFRITVLLPKDQLYVARLGARVPLRKLLELVCDHKQLEAHKYEFRNPVDSSQSYSCDLTIGAVGLSEVRLCHKSEAYDNFNADEVIKLHRTSVIRDSLSSSEFSSRNSKHTTKTASPYSSSNSLNSMDSTGMSFSRSPVGPPPVTVATTMPKMLAPPRKKRAAPRPPSQTAIPERSALIITNGNQPRKSDATIKGATPVNGVVTSGAMPTRRDFYVFASNLTLSTRISNGSLSVDCNGNSATDQNQNRIPVPKESHIFTDAQVEHKNALNLCSSESVQNTSVDADNTSQKFPEPSPRKQIQLVKKKAAPAPPTRASAGFDDNVSITSSTLSTPEESQRGDNLPSSEAVTTEPVPLADPQDESSSKSATSTPAGSTDTFNAPDTNVCEMTSQRLQALTAKKVTEASTMDTSTSTSDANLMPSVPKPVPRVTTTGTMKTEPEYEDSTESAQPNNVSKIMLNRTPTPEPRSLSTEPSLNEINGGITDVTHTPLLNHNGNNTTEDDDNCSKQADSGIGGEPVPSPIPDSLPSDGSATDGKLSTFESSSDDDDMVKVYNFKLGKTLVQQIEDQQGTLENTAVVGTVQSNNTDDVSGKPVADTASLTSDTASWNFQIPILPPPNFADQKKAPELLEAVPDVPITPKINERPMLVFEPLATVEREPEKETDDADSVAVETAKLTFPLKEVSPLPSPISSPMNDILDELNTILNEQRMESLIKKPEENNEIEAAKPNSLSNFSIASITQQPSKPEETYNSIAATSPSPESAPEEDKLYRKRSSITNSTNLLKQRRSVARADSCHATMQQPHATSNASALEATSPPQQEDLNLRYSSYLSLTKLDQNAHSLHRRRSSSELSIGESPSLQSLEIIKTILSSRKNSLNNSGSDGESKSNNAEVLHRGIDSAADSKPKHEQQMIEEKTHKISSSVEKPPKIYRYSGPPSINFSTWNERPKVQVAIKNEGDYIFGGKKAANQNTAVTSATAEMSHTEPARDFRASTPAEDFREFKFRSLENPSHITELKQETANTMEAPKTPELVPQKVTTTMRMGIPEKPFRVPITVKSIEDGESEMNVDFRASPQRTTSPPKAFTISDSEKSLENVTPPRPLTLFGNPSTLPRSGAHMRLNMPSPEPALLRSTSITQLQNKSRSTAMDVKTAPVPFGQNTLRKTGFKEKILAKDAAEQEVKCVTICAGNNSTTCPRSAGQNLAQAQAQNRTQTHTPRFTPSPQTSPTKSLRSAKLELKLQKSTSVYVNHTNSPVTLAAVNTSKSAPTAGIPPPLSRNSLAKRNGHVVTPTLDTREQLLDAIRNFKHNELNRS